MRVFCGNGITIGVDVSPPHEIGRCGGLRYTVAAFRRCAAVSDCGEPGKSFMPSIPLILMPPSSSAEFLPHDTRGLADLICSRKCSVSSGTTALADEIVAHSYRHTMEKIEV